ncbi:hypothetical protein J6590_082386, partial [Homalodisca vitripennis]
RMVADKKKLGKLSQVLEESWKAGVKSERIVMTPVMEQDVIKLMFQVSELTYKPVHCLYL